MLNKYIIISGAYNEEANIERTIKSVLKQTIKPVAWIIIDDGSTDKTRDLVDLYARDYKWIKLFSFQKDEVEFGTHAVVNFYKGFEKIVNNNWDFIVKLDTDLDIDRNDFFEFQLLQFDKNKSLGISSGITYSIKNGEKELTLGRPKWRTGGAMKMYRKDCFEAIGGLKPIYGWDGLDEYQAMFHNWQTRTFFDLHVNHLGKERALNREKELWLIKARAKSYYQRGYPIEFVFLKGIMLMIKSFTFGFSFYKSYYHSVISDIEVMVTREEKQFIRKFQYLRLIKK